MQMRRVIDLILISDLTPKNENVSYWLTANPNPWLSQVAALAGPPYCDFNRQSPGADFGSEWHHQLEMAMVISGMLWLERIVHLYLCHWAKPLAAICVILPVRMCTKYKHMGETVIKHGFSEVPSVQTRSVIFCIFIIMIHICILFTWIMRQLC